MAGRDWLRNPKLWVSHLSPRFLGGYVSFCFIMVLEFPLQGMSEDANEKRNTQEKKNILILCNAILPQPIK